MLSILLPVALAQAAWRNLGCFPVEESATQDNSIYVSTCVSWRDFDKKCRGGLPFYRFPATEGCNDCLDADFCKLQCVSKGLDIAGFISGGECRCGASLENLPVWSTLLTDDIKSLEAASYLFPPGESSGVINCQQMDVWAFVGDRDANGVPRTALVSKSKKDDEYIR